MLLLIFKKLQYITSLEDFKGKQETYIVKKQRLKLFNKTHYTYERVLNKNEY
jgi:hypothetical protein